MATNLVIVQRNKDAVISLVTAILSPICYVAGSVLLAILMENETIASKVVSDILSVTALILYILVPLILAVTAVTTGISGLRQINESAEKGKGIAITGIVIGSLVAAAYACLSIAIIGVLIT